MKKDVKSEKWIKITIAIAKIMMAIAAIAGVIATYITLLKPPISTDGTKNPPATNPKPEDAAPTPPKPEKVDRFKGDETLPPNEQRGAIQQNNYGAGSPTQFNAPVSVTGGTEDSPVANPKPKDAAPTQPKSDKVDRFKEKDETPPSPNEQRGIIQQNNYGNGSPTQFNAPVSVEVK